MFFHSYGRWAIKPPALLSLSSYGLRSGGYPPTFPDFVGLKHYGEENV
jgi:hypothetical protein